MLLVLAMQKPLNEMTLEDILRPSEKGFILLHTIAVKKKLHLLSPETLSAIPMDATGWCWQHTNDDRPYTILFDAIHYNQINLIPIDTLYSLPQNDQGWVKTTPGYPSLFHKLIIDESSQFGLDFYRRFPMDETAWFKKMSCHSTPIYFAALNSSLNKFLNTDFFPLSDPQTPVKLNALSRHFDEILAHNSPFALTELKKPEVRATFEDYQTKIKQLKAQSLALTMNRDKKKFILEP
jgi:hypothetical protein